MGILTPLCGRNSYHGGHEIYNFGTGLNSLSNYAVDFYLVPVKVKKFLNIYIF